MASSCQARRLSGLLQVRNKRQPTIRQCSNIVYMMHTSCSADMTGQYCCQAVRPPAQGTRDKQSQSLRSIFGTCTLEDLCSQPANQTAKSGWTPGPCATGRLHSPLDGPQYAVHREKRDIPHTKQTRLRI